MNNAKSWRQIQEQELKIQETKFDNIPDQPIKTTSYTSFWYADPKFNNFNHHTPWYKFKWEDPEVMSFKTGLTVLFFHGVFLFWVLLIIAYNL